MNPSVSPSRQYVAICCKNVMEDGKPQYKGHRLVHFHLPEKDADYSPDPIKNDNVTALHYYLNWIDSVSMVETVCLTMEEVADFMGNLPVGKF